MTDRESYPAKVDVIVDCCRHQQFVACSAVLTCELAGHSVALSLDVHSQVSCFAIHSDDDVPVHVLLKVCGEGQRQELTVMTSQSAHAVQCRHDLSQTRITR